MKNHNPNSADQEETTPLEIGLVAVESDDPKELYVACLSSLQTFCQSRDGWVDRLDELLGLLRRAIVEIGIGVPARNRNQSAALFRKAIEWFTAADLHRLQSRVDVIDALGDQRFPALSDADLANQLEEFVSYQDQHRDFLVKTGLPPTKFRGFPMLYQHLGRLYDTRQTEQVYPPDEFVRSPKASNPAPYTWVRLIEPEHLKFPPEDPEDPRSLLLTDSRLTHKHLRPCEMDSADPYRSLSQEDAIRIERMRSPYFDVRRDVLRALRKTVDSNCGRGDLLTRCLAMVADAFDREQIEFLFSIDRAFLYCDAAGGGLKWFGTEGGFHESPVYSPKMNPGGLTNLLYVTNEIESQCLVGVWDDATNHAPGCLVSNRKGPILLETPGFTTGWRSYFEAWRYCKTVNELDALNKFCDDLCKGKQEADGHTKCLAGKVRQWLEESVCVPLSGRVDPRVAAIVKEALPDMLEMATANAFAFQQRQADIAAAIPLPLPEGPYGDRQWVWNGKLVPGDLQPKQVQVGRILFASVGKPVAYEDLAKNCWVNKEDVEDDAIGKQGRLLTSFFNKYNVPLTVRSRPLGGRRQMMMLKL